MDKEAGRKTLESRRPNSRVFPGSLSVTRIFIWYNKDMPRTLLLRKLATYIILLALLNFFGSLFHWYEIVWWFDMPMHFIGGVCVMYIAVVIFGAAPATEHVGRYLYRCVGVGIALGLAWEVLEFILYKYSGGSVFIPLDSLSDVLFDIAGIFAAAFAMVPIISNTKTVAAESPTSAA